MNRSRSNARYRLGAAAIAAVTTAALASCGDSAESSSATNATGESGPDAGALKTLFEGTPGEPPTSSPPAAKGKSVVWVSCGSIAPDCAVPEAAAEEAAATLGLNFSSTDGNLNQAGGYLTAFRAALAQKPDAIIVHALDCTSIKPGIAEASDADVPVLGVETANCPELTDMNYSKDIPDTDEYFRSWGRSAAAYLVAASGGAAQVLNSEGTDAVFPLMNEGFVEELEKCDGCEIVDTIEFTAAEQVPNGPWIQQFRAALTRNPTATAAFIPSDYAMTDLGGGKAAREANPKMMVVGGSGSSAGMGGVASDLITANTFAHDPGWMGYAAIDTINRILQGEPTVPQGINTVVVDKKHNLPDESGSAYVSPTDWKGAYEKIWAAAGK